MTDLFKHLKGKCVPLLCSVIFVLWIWPEPLHAQEHKKVIADGTEGETLPAKDSLDPAKKKPWNVFKGSFSTFRFGFAFLFEYAGFSQNQVGKAQMDTGNIDLKSKFDIRDIRVFLSGQLVKSKRDITWKMGLMYDGSLGSLFIRESGVMIAVPELSGHFFIGRTKEGVSMSKVMSGYAVEMPERYMASDPIPILADGIKWLGYLPRQKIIWNIGIYTDWTSRAQSFATYSWQFASRIGWLPIKSETSKTNLHVAFNFRLGQPDNDKIRLRSRPEANPAPFFIDTGEFNSNQSTYTGGEIYFSRGPFMLATEYFWDKFRVANNSGYLFQGGEAMASYIFTRQSRPYTTVGGIYSFVPVTKSVFKGGTGTWEAVLRFSTFSLNDGPISGGKMSRISPIVNWYLSDNLRFELCYGYGILERFNTKGITHILQSRIQFMIR